MLLVLLHKFIMHCICKAKKGDFWHLGGMASLVP